MTRRTTVFAFALALTASITVMGSAVASEKKTYTVRMATVVPEGSPWHDSLVRIQERWNEKSDGRLRLRAFLGGALGDENQTVAETRRGRIQMVGASVGSIGSVVPEVNVLELPYLFRSLEEADHILDNVIYDDLEAIFRERGFVLLMWSENGYRNYGTRFGFVKSPADLRNRTMRSQENRVHLATFRAFGARPVPIPTTEALPALQTGVVDGYDQTPLFAFATSLHNQTKYWTVSDHIYQPGAILINKDFYESLPEDLQELMMEGREQETLDSRAGIRALTPLLLENLQAAGLEMHHLTDEERAAFEEAAKPVWKDFEENAPTRTRELYHKIVKGLEEYRAEQ